MKQYLKRTAILFLTACLLLGMLIGCGGDPQDSTGDNGTTAPAENTVEETAGETFAETTGEEAGTAPEEDPETATDPTTDPTTDPATEPETEPAAAPEESSEGTTAVSSAKPIETKVTAETKKPGTSAATTEQAAIKPVESKKPAGVATTAAPETSPKEEKPYTLSASELKALYDSVKGTTVPIGIWSTPPSYLRKNPADFEKAWQRVADAGITYAILLEESSSLTWTKEALDAAHKAGVGVYVNLGYGSYNPTAEKVINFISETENYPALLGYYLMDEPLPDKLEELTRVREAVLASDRVRNKKFSMSVNLLPTYTAGLTDPIVYAEYVHGYLSAFKTDILWFDYYNWPVGIGNTNDGMMGNLAIVRAETLKTGTPAHAFIQSSSWPGMREPKENELRLTANIQMAFGMKGMTYFLFWSPYEGNGYSGAVNHEGEERAMYGYMKKLNTNLQRMKGVFLDFESKGVLFHKNDAYAKAVEAASPGTVLKSFGPLASVDSTSPFLIGCFEKGGKSGYYIVNTQTANGAARPSALKLSGFKTYQIWGADGLEEAGGNTEIAFRIAPGEAKFIIID